MKRQRLKKYCVRLYFEQHVDVTVQADSEKDAIKEAYCQVDNDNATMWSERQPCADPDVEEL